MRKRSSVLEYGYIGILTNVNDSGSTNLIMQYYRAVKIWTVTLFMAYVTKYAWTSELIKMKSHL